MYHMAMNRLVCNAHVGVCMHMLPAAALYACMYAWELSELV